ncbi:MULTISPECIES: BapA/Bap/LapF family large adhesin [unclassified Halomonas]|uniref:BapA/Bap/LapF family large adhesin n=1 Tax=unclassified Halomonas TaxID=2609666 RepID=UPI00186584F5|nr:MULTISPECIES: BapA/Bap/LapF family large adhesin [unclassified Halomonas]
MPVSESRFDSGTDSVLVNIGQVTNTYEFEVPEGSLTDVSFTADVGALLALLDNAFVDLEVFENGEWVSLDDSSSGGLLDLIGIFGENAQVEASGLEAGDYRVIYGGGGLLGLATSVSWSAEFTDNSLTDYEGVAGDPIMGNVITDPSFAEGEQDQLGVDGLAVVHILLGGVFVEAGAGTVVEGEYGQLTIDADGNYEYVPNGDVESVGKVDVFEYQLVHPDGSTDTANLYVRIDSEDADLVWDDNDPSAPATAVMANDDIGAAQIEVVNVVTTTTEEEVIDYSWLIGFLGIVIGDTEGSSEFSLAEDTLTDLTINIDVGSLASLLDSVDFQLYKLEGDGSETLVMDMDQASLLDLIGIFPTSVAVTVEGLEAGNYRLDVSNGSVVSLPGSVSVGLIYETTDLTEFTAGEVFETTGNVIDDDTLGSEHTTLSVMNEDGVFVIPGHGGVVIEGEYGVLTIMSNGDYSYVPNAEMANIGETEVFTYKLTHPNGDESEATLSIELEEADVVPFAFDDSDDADMADEGADLGLEDVLDLGEESEELVFPESEDSNEEDEQATSGTDDFEEMPMGDFSEPQNPLDDEFDQTPLI